MRPYFCLLAWLTLGVAASAESLPDLLTTAHRLLRKDDVAAADEIAAKALSQAADSAAVRELMGELHFRKGDVTSAETDFKAAIRLDGELPRAWWGLARVCDCASMHHTAELYFRKAHKLAPDDPDILLSYARFLKPHEHIEALQGYLTLAQHYAEPDELQNVRRHIEVDQRLGDRKLRRLISEYGATEAPLFAMLRDPKHIRAVALPVTVNNGKPVKLLLDTGAGGIILRTKAAEKAGLKMLAETVVRGLGEQGDRPASVAVADRVQIGDAIFADFPVLVSDKKVLADEDGLIGTDVFSDFLITLDFANFKLILGPLPGGLPDRERTHDRVISPELVGFTPVFRIGHTLLVRTRISDFGPVLFVLDTGASTTLISKKAAAEATKVSADNSVILKGLSGRVKDVAQADELYLQFAGFRQKHLGMMAFDLDDTSKNTGIEISGLLGLPLLHLFTITIDYPDGMVKFEYKPL